MDRSSKTTILVTGGAGFVGRVLCNELSKTFPSSRRILVARRHNIEISGWESVVAEISDFDMVRQVVHEVRPDIVLHLAAQASVANSQDFAEQTWRTNFMGTVALGSAISQLAPSATFLFVSSGEVYGANLRPFCVDEKTIPHPLSPYSLSKLAAERALSDILGPSNKLILARPFNHTGSGQDRRFVLPSLASQIVEAEIGAREPIIQVGNLDAERDFLHVNDVVAAYVELIKVSHDLPSSTVVNVSSKQALPIRYYLTEMLKMARLDIGVVIDQEKMRPSDIACSCGDNTLLRSLTPWSPTVSAPDLCRELLDYWRNVKAHGG